MSMLFGVVHMDGRRVEPDALAWSDARLARCGPDGGSAWSEGSAALGHRLLCVTPESRLERMPLSARDGKVMLVATARLDNRDELCALFEIGVSDRPKIADTELVRRAFERWGERCVEHLFGDWSLAAWDADLRRLFLARDQLGNTGLHYAIEGSTVSFSSTSWSLPGGARPIDEANVASFLVMMGGDVSFTPWAGVKRLGPGECLTVEPGRHRVRRYWDMDSAPDVRLGSTAEYVEGFLDLFRTAVRTRLRSIKPIASTLSAGLDSGSVTVLAAEALRERGERLMALTSVPMFEATPGSRISDEWPVAEIVSRAAMNVDHVAIRGDAHSPLASIDLVLDAMPEFHLATTNLFWMFDLLRTAQDGGAGVVLTGQLGNGGVSWSGGRARVASAFMRGRFIYAARALSETRQAEGSSLPRALFRHVIGPIGSPVRRVVRARPRPWAPWSSASGISPEFARRMNLRRKVSWQDLGVTWPISPERERDFVIGVNAAIAGPYWHAMGASHHLEVRDPTADIRLIEYCLGLPEDQYVGREGRRLLIRRAMAGLLPDEARLSQVRARQGSDVPQRLAQDAEALEASMNDLATSPIARRYFDIDSLRRAQRSIVGGATGDAGLVSSGSLLRAILIGRLLR